jgi:hypothetical protein
MTAKQPAGRLSLPVICGLSVLLALAAGAMYLSAGPAIRPHDAHPTASVAKPHFVNASFSANTDASHQRVLNAYGRLPLAFDANQGQTDPQVKYVARGNGYSLFLTSNKAVLSMSSGSSSPLRDAMIRRYMGFTRWHKVMQQRARHAKTQVAVLNMEMVGANPQPQIVGQNLLPGVTNYLIGNDPAKWHTKVPQYARVEYQSVYPGVDLAFHGEQRQLEFDFLVAPQADPAPIALQFTGAKRMKLDESGNLLLTSAAGDVTMKKPVAYQEGNGGRQIVEAKFVMKSHGQVGLTLGNYDRSRELVIDPSLNFATYFGGSGQDEAFGIALDSSLNAYITGDTTSVNFPGSPTPTLIGPGGGFDAFVTELSSDGTAIVFTTLFGGTGGDVGNAIAIDQNSGDILVAGGTSSSDFPVTVGTAFQSVFGGPNCAVPANCPNLTSNAFLVDLDSTGSTRVYSTYFGGDNTDNAFALVLDTGGNAYIAGETSSGDFPAPTGSLNHGAGETGAFDGFVAKINPAGSGSASRVYAVFVGGTLDDLITGIQLDAGAPSVLAAGDTLSTDLLAATTTTGSFQKCLDTPPPNPGSCPAGKTAEDAFVTKVNPAGSGFTYSTYLGGSGDDGASGLAADPTLNPAPAYITGFTTSTDFPVTTGAFQTTYPAGNSLFTAFVTQVNSGGTGLGYSSFLGGNTADSGNAIALDPLENAYVTGTTLSTNFPTVDAFQGTFGGGNSDAFVAEIDPTGATEIYSSYLGGTGDENFENNTALGGAIVIGAVDPTHFVPYLAGITTSTSGLAKSAEQGTYGGGATDAFVAQVSASSGSSGADFSIGVDPTSVSVTAGASSPSITVSVVPLNGFNAAVTLSCSIPSSATGVGCTFGSTSISTLPGSTTLTITTKANSSAKTDHRRSGIFYAMWLPIGGLALFGAGFSSRRRKLFLLVVGSCLVLGLIFLPSCSSSSSGGGGGGGGGTPAGTYTINVTGTSTGAGPHSAGEQLTVN